MLETVHEVSGMPDELAAKAEALTLLADVLRRSLDGPEEALIAYEAAAESYMHLRKVSLSMAGLRWRVGDLEALAQAYEDILQSAQDEPARRAAALNSLGAKSCLPARRSRGLE